MGHGTPIVPSKCALRALRRLAFQGTTILTAVGGLCGVAALSYDARQRVKLAEKIIDTKRTLRTVSNGQGTAHIRRMFEAAERGEDFCLDRARASERRKRRNYSAVAARKDEVDESDDDLNIALELHRSLNDLRWKRGRGGLNHSEEQSMQSPHLVRSAKYESDPISRPQIQGKSGSGHIGTAALPHAPEVGRSLLLGPVVSPQRDRKSWHDDPSQVTSNKLVKPVASMEEPTGILRSDFSLSGPGDPRPKVFSSDSFYDLFAQGAIPSRKRKKSRRETSQKDSRETEAEGSTPVLPFNSSGADSTVAATQQEHKLGSQELYSKPKATNLIGCNLTNRSTHPSTFSPATTENESKVDGRTNTQNMRPGTVAGMVFQPSYTFQTSEREATPRDSARAGVDGSPMSSISLYTSPSSETTPLSLLSSEGFRDWPISQMEQQPTQDEDHRDTPRPESQVYMDPDYDELDDEPGELDIVNHHRFIDVLDQQHNAAVTTCGSNGVMMGTSNDRDTTSSEAKSQGSLERYSQVVNDIAECISRRGTRESKRFWLKQLEVCGSRGNGFDVAEMESLYTRFREQLGQPRTTPAFLRLLARKLLANDPYSKTAVELLVPVHLAPAQKSMAYIARSDIFETAKHYLDDHWSASHDVAVLLSDFGHVIFAAKRSNVALDENLFESVLRPLCSVADMENAQILFDEMIDVYHIEPTFHTRSVMAHGYASSGDWDEVYRRLEGMHYHGLSRTRPLGYSSLFQRVFSEQLRQKPIEQAYYYLIHAIGYLGLVPTSTISNSAIQACLIAHRYDLVREWVEFVRTTFPQVAIATNAFAWHFGDTWDRIEASCADIESACNALSYAANNDVFTDRVKGVAREALAADLAKSLHAAEANRSACETIVTHDVDTSADLDTYLERARRYVGDQEREQADNNQVERIRSQIEAIMRIDRLFTNGEPEKRHVSLKEIEEEKTRASQRSLATNKYAKVYAGFPGLLVEDKLPSYAEIARLIKEYYNHRQMHGLGADDLLIEYVCEKLKRHRRQFDVLRLLDELVGENVLTVPHAQPPRPGSQRSIVVTLDVQLLSLWLRCAFEIKSANHLRKVLWTVLDGGNEVRITGSFLLLARMFARKLIRSRGHIANEEEQAELEYMLGRVRRKYWAQKGVSSRQHDKEDRLGWSPPGSVKGNAWKARMWLLDDRPTI